MFRWLVVAISMVAASAVSAAFAKELRVGPSFQERAKKYIFQPPCDDLVIEPEPAPKPRTKMKKSKKRPSRKGRGPE